MRFLVSRPFMPTRVCGISGFSAPALMPCLDPFPLKPSAHAPTDQRFKRIVLRSSCMTDHFPVAYKMGLSDVLASVSARQQQVQHAA